MDKRKSRIDRIHSILDKGKGNTSISCGRGSMKKRRKKHPPHKSPFSLTPGSDPPARKETFFPCLCPLAHQCHR